MSCGSVELIEELYTVCAVKKVRQYNSFKTNVNEVDIHTLCVHVVANVNTDCFFVPS